MEMGTSLCLFSCNLSNTYKVCLFQNLFKSRKSASHLHCFIGDRTCNPDDNVGITREKCLLKGANKIPEGVFFCLRRSIRTPVRSPVGLRPQLQIAPGFGIRNARFLCCIA